MASFGPEADSCSAKPHSLAMGAPFSATERFISGTTSTSASVTTAKIQKQSN
jgi:hypothetical protein